jgi:DNA repair ATPase RecN
MESQQASRSEGRIHIANVGGIEKTSVTFSPGVTILGGRDATNRTSLLQAIRAALGSDDVTIKGDANEADVQLQLDDETYTRRLQRRSGAIVSDGEPYLDDPTLADLFAFLIESNEARRAVARDDDLRELIMRSVDTDTIQVENDDLFQERQALESKLDEIEQLKGDLPGLEEERTRLNDQIDEKREELEAKEAELKAADADLDEPREDKSPLDDKLAELRSKRSDLDYVRYDLETERESLYALKQEQRDLQSEADELPAAPMGEVDELNAEIGRLREQK